MQNLKRIPINIWDDYWDDGYVPVGEIQKTYIYVEDTDIPKDKCKECLELLLEYIKENFKLVGVKLFLECYNSMTKYPTLDEMYQFERWQINIENLTHKVREKLVEKLKTSNLSVDNTPFDIYSES